MRLLKLLTHSVCHHRLDPWLKQHPSPFRMCLTPRWLLERALHGGRRYQPCFAWDRRCTGRVPQNWLQVSCFCYRRWWKNVSQYSLNKNFLHCGLRHHRQAFDLWFGGLNLGFRSFPWVPRSAVILLTIRQISLHTTFGCQCSRGCRSACRYPFSRRRRWPSRLKLLWRYSYSLWKWWWDGLNTGSWRLPSVFCRVLSSWLQLLSTIEPKK